MRDLYPLQNALVRLVDFMKTNSVAPITVEEIGAMHAVTILGAIMCKQSITEPFRFIQRLSGFSVAVHLRKW